MSAPPTLGEWLRERPFGLAMSSGFFGFFAHAGVLTALLEKDLTPARVSGSSAGALVVGGFAAGLSPEDFRREMLRLKKSDFWDPAFGLGLLRGRRFREILEGVFPVDDFARTRIPAAVSVFDVFALKTRVLDDGDLRRAVHASCAVPFMFHPVWIDGRPYLDGGIADRPGLVGMPEGRVLYHHLPSNARWRLKRPEPPRREGMVSLEVETLPRVSPNRLGMGEVAFKAAYDATCAALARPLAEARVVVGSA